jgi:cbb3-type cytochrome oxidase subunit 3
MKIFFITDLSRDGNRQSKNFVAPLVISIVALVLVILVIILIIWYCLRKRNRKRNDVSKKPEVKFIDQPTYYNDFNSA